MLEKMLKFTTSDIDRISLENDFAFEPHRWIEAKWIQNLFIEPQKYNYRVPIYYKVDERRRMLCPSVLVKNFPRAELPKIDVPHVVFGQPKGDDPLEPYYSYYEIGVRDGAHRHRGYQESPKVLLELNTFGMSGEELLDPANLKLTDDERYTFANILTRRNLAHIYIKFKRPISNRRMYSDRKGYMHLLLKFEECGNLIFPENRYLNYGFSELGNLFVSIGKIKVENYASELGCGKIYR